ncbi:hypothetical protein JAAARDRAFT_639549 [Jaapia argillacea MUCL 33604]|uniref:Uncharacterized protein n=1 Tax=Jaapia argillacea MUCL 33604 TaxID=933084 RepID=A0A067PGH1_9AGAM|nr:hypothetical protein JAAARDRAFT_639549 [Jaapia argillacea MUCL 33604]
MDDESLPICHRFCGLLLHTVGLDEDYPTCQCPTYQSDITVYEGDREDPYAGLTRREREEQARADGNIDPYLTCDSQVESPRWSQAGSSGGSYHLPGSLYDERLPICHLYCGLPHYKQNHNDTYPTCQCLTYLSDITVFEGDPGDPYAGLTRSQRGAQAAANGHIDPTSDWGSLVGSSKGSQAGSSRWSQSGSSYTRGGHWAEPSRGSQWESRRVDDDDDDDDEDEDGYEGEEYDN